MISLQYFDGEKWNTISTWGREDHAWISLGGLEVGYRTVGSDGNVLTEPKGEIMTDKQIEMYNKVMAIASKIYEEEKRKKYPLVAPELLPRKIVSDQIKALAKAIVINLIPEEL